ncbi:MAG: enoyl-CoA hydratase/isomerase family protein, partial [Thermoanaerobaculia bacterium]
CDVRIMADGEFLIGLNEVQVGIPMPPVIFQALRRQVGARQAERLCATAQLLPAAEARRIGLVDELAAPESVVARAVEWCNALLALPPEPMARTRRLVRADLVSLFAATEAEVAGLVDQWFSPETQGPLRALVERLAKKKG